MPPGGLETGPHRTRTGWNESELELGSFMKSESQDIAQPGDGMIFIDGCGRDRHRRANSESHLGIFGDFDHAIQNCM